MKKGIDISYHQGTVDFAKLKSEIDFIILREGYGSKQKDTKFDEYVKGCIKNNIPILGIYHFSYAKFESEAVKEADLAVKRLQEVALSPETIVFFDYEYDSVKYAAKYGVKIGKEECRRLTEAFCKRVEELGYKAGIYCNVDYYKNMYDPKDFDGRIFWLADYASGDPRYDCDIRQQSSSHTVNGISGKVDLNYILKDFKMVDVSETPKIRQIKATGAPKKFDKDIAGQYKVTGNLYMRNDAGTGAERLCYMKKGATCICEGYYTQLTNKWFLVTAEVDGIEYTGFSSSKYLVKV